MPRVVVVTGASAGVGRATAIEFARLGATVALIARGEAGLRAAAADVEACGGTPLTISCDVSDESAVERAAREIEDAVGPIDVWVNNAMATVFAPTTRLEPRELERVTHVTYLGTAYGTMAALRRMRERDRGTIVNVSSALAFRSIALQAPYCAAKAAIRGFTDAVRVELLHDHSRVRITLVHLPAINTPQFDWCRTHVTRKPQPVAPVYQPEAAARAIVRAASNGRRDTTLGSVNRLVIAGTKLAPALFDHFAARTTWEGQLDHDQVSADRRDNLENPVDAAPECVRGAHGRFDHRSNGVLDVVYLRAIPDTLAALARAVVDRVRDREGALLSHFSRARS